MFSPNPLGKGPRIHRSARSLNKLLRSQVGRAKKKELPDASHADLGFASESIVDKVKESFLGRDGRIKLRKLTLTKQPDMLYHSVRGPQKKGRTGFKEINFEVYSRLPQSHKSESWKKGLKLYNGHLSIIPDAATRDIDPRSNETFRED